MAEPFRLEEGTLRTGISIGLVFGGRSPGLTPEVLLAQADVALCHCQAAGRRAVLPVSSGYEPGAGGAAAAGGRSRRGFGAAGDVSAFPAAMRGQWQPARVRGAAALAPPRARVSSARRNSSPLPSAPAISAPSGCSCWRKPAARRCCWPAHLRVAVNLSAVQLAMIRCSIPIKSILARTGLPPQRLELEITESVLIEDAARVGALLQAMHEFGLELAIDDFGTGYSNLSSSARFLRRTAQDRPLLHLRPARQFAMRPALCGRLPGWAMRWAWRCWPKAWKRKPNCAWCRPWAATRCRAITSPARCRRPISLPGWSAARRRVCPVLALMA